MTRILNKALSMFVTVVFIVALSACGGGGGGGSPGNESQTLSEDLNSAADIGGQVADNDGGAVLDDSLVETPAPAETEGSEGDDATQVLTVRGVVKTPQGALAANSVVPNVMDFFFPAAYAGVSGLDVTGGVQLVLVSVQIDADGVLIEQELVRVNTEADGSFEITLPDGYDYSSDLFIGVELGSELVMRAVVASEEVDINPLSEFIVATLVDALGQNLHSIDLAKLRQLVNAAIAVDPIDLTFSTSISDAVAVVDGEMNSFIYTLLGLLFPQMVNFDNAGCSDVEECGDGLDVTLDDQGTSAQTDSDSSGSTDDSGSSSDIGGSSDTSTSDSSDTTTSSTDDSSSLNTCLQDGTCSTGSGSSGGTSSSGSTTQECWSTQSCAPGDEFPTVEGCDHFDQSNCQNVGCDPIFCGDDAHGGGNVGCGDWCAPPTSSLMRDDFSLNLVSNSREGEWVPAVIRTTDPVDTTPVTREV